MATARRHWFRVADSVAREDWSNDVAATFLRLGGMLNTRWARDGLDAVEACSIVLRPADLMACTGSQSLARARRIVNELAAHISLTVVAQGANTRLEWPKWAEFQKLDAPKKAEDHSETSPKMPPPQDAPARRKTQDAGERGRASAPATDASSGDTTAFSLEPPEWVAVCDAFALYDPKRVPHSFNEKRQKRMATVMRRYGATAPVDAIHGYVALRILSFKPGRSDYDPWNHFTPETIWGESKIAAYLDADRRAQAEGRTRPYSTASGGSSSLDSTVVNIFEAIKRERGASLAGL